MLVDGVCFFVGDKDVAFGVEGYAAAVVGFRGVHRSHGPEALYSVMPLKPATKMSLLDGSTATDCGVLLSGTLMNVSVSLNFRAFWPMLATYTLPDASTARL